MSLLNKVILLIESCREGPYWDFKECVYSNNGDFVHDVLCMANSLSGCDKYIIMGVSDPKSGCEIRGLPKDRKSQADYIDTLRNLQFAEARPEIELRTFIVDGKEIDVLVVYESSLKPYYLTKQYEKVLPYHIYTRTLDSNTPKDKSADFGIVERMWRQRFNLDLPPKEKFEKILDDISNWHIDVGNEENAYYEPSPEYQIVFKEMRDGREDYSYFFINEKSFFGEAEFRFHSTKLFDLQYGYVDECRIPIAIPEIHSFDSSKNYFYYCFIENTVRYKFHKLVNGNSLYFARGGLRYNPFFVFKSENEREEFEEYLRNIPDLETKIVTHEFGNSLYKVKPYENLRFLAFAIDAYKEWKNIQSV